MSKSEKYTSVQLVPKESVLAYGEDFVKHIVDDLKRTISEKVLDRAELSDVILSLKPMRVTEQFSWNQLEYRLNVTVTDLVRCKDCKYMIEHYDTDGNAPYRICSEWDSGTDYDGYCHYGERKDNEIN